MKTIAGSHLITGQNFMTPNRRGLWSIVYQSKMRHVELSQGEGISHQPIYGVTVRPDNDGPVEGRLSRMFYSEIAALAYIQQLDDNVSGITNLD